MVIRCGSRVTLPGPGLDIYDLHHPYHPYVETPKPAQTYAYPVLTLSLPYLSRHSKHAFRRSAFIHGSNNVTCMDRPTNTVRTGEADVISILIRCTREQHVGELYQLVLFISKSRLLQLATDKLSAFKLDSERQRKEKEKKPDAMLLNLNTPVGYDPTKVYKLQSIEMKYDDWTERGRYVRWLDATKIRLVSKCAMYGSTFACTTNPEWIGVSGYTSVGGAFEHVCLLEFKKRLFGQDEDQRGVVRTIDYSVNTPLTSQLDADVRGGLPFRVSWFKKPSSREWADVLLDEGHLVARLLNGFDIFTI